MTQKLDACLNFLASTPFFFGFSEEHLKYLLKNSNCKTYNKRKILLLHGETSKYLYVIVDGWVKLFQETIEGKESVISLYTRGDCFGRRACLTEGDKYPYNAK